MATAEELLTGGNVITVDFVTRTINIPESIKNLGVEGDDDTQRLEWRMPRYFKGIDLSKFVIRINYKNAEGGEDIAEVSDIVVEDETVSFVWQVERFAYLYAGDVEFALCLRDIADDGEILREIGTTNASLPVLKSLHTDATTIEAQLDLIAVAINEALEKAKDSELKGDPGYTPVKGVDYYTEAERNEFVELVTNDVNAGFANGIKGSKSSNAGLIQLNDVSTVQHTITAKITSKNMIKFPHAEIAGEYIEGVPVEKTKSGVTFTVNPDQSIGISGRPTENVSFALSYDGGNGIYLEQGKTYTLSTDAKFTGSTGYIYMQIIKDGVNMHGVTVRSDDVTFVATASGYGVVGVVVLNGVNYDKTIHVQLEEGDTATEFTPYVSLEDEITPAGVSPARVTVCGKNLLKYPYADTTQVHNGITFTDNGDGSITINGTATGNAYYDFARSDAAIPAVIKRGVYTFAYEDKSWSSGDAPTDGISVTFGLTDSSAGDGGHVEGYKVINITRDTSYYAFVTVDAGAVIDNYAIYPRLYVGNYDQSNTDLPPIPEFEQYVDGGEWNHFDDCPVESLDPATSPIMTMYTNLSGTTLKCEYTIDTQTYIDRGISNLKAELKALINGLHTTPDE